MFLETLPADKQDCWGDHKGDAPALLCHYSSLSIEFLHGRSEVRTLNLQKHLATQFLSRMASNFLVE